MTRENRASNWAGGVSATEHLTQLGHRRIGFIAGRPGLWCSRARLDGYRAGIEAVGLAVDPELVVQGDFHYASGFEGATRLLALDDRPTAVFAASDQMALGVYEAARRGGLGSPCAIPARMRSAVSSRTRSTSSRTSGTAPTLRMSLS